MSALACPRCGHEYEPRTHPLTEKQHALLSFLAEYIDRLGYSPSFEEIAERFSYRSLATVHEHLTNLERKGWILRQYNLARSLEVLVRPDQQPHLAAVRVPAAPRPGKVVIRCFCGHAWEDHLSPAPHRCTRTACACQRFLANAPAAAPLAAPEEPR